MHEMYLHVCLILIFFGLKKEHLKQIRIFYQLKRRACKESVWGKKVEELIKYRETSQKKHIAKRKALSSFVG